MTKDELMQERFRVALHAAYLWGRDNGEGRSEKNFNDFMVTSLVKEKQKQLKEYGQTDTK